MATQMRLKKITPDLAAKWLSGHAKNRNVRQSWVKTLAGSMTRGEWVLNGEAIKFDENGNLIDGQHRLLAVIASGVTIESFVATGLPVTITDALDLGKKRTVSDVLRMEGYPDGVTLANALHWIARLESGVATAKSRPGWTALTPKSALAVLERHPGVLDFLSIGNAIGRTCSTSRGWFTAAAYWCSRIDENDARDFFDKLHTGADLPVNSPIHQLRKVLLADAVATNRKSIEYMSAVTIKAWNLYRDGATVSQLRFKMGGARPEAVPVAA